MRPRPAATTNVTLRLEPSLVRALRKIARDEGRSLNAQVVHEIKDYIHGHRRSCARLHQRRF